MYFNRKNAEQKNWRMIKKGKHFLFGCSLVFAVGAALVAPTVKADTADTGEVETKTTNSVAEASSSDEVGTYKAPAVEVSTTSPVVAENPTSSEATSAKTAKEADGVQLPSLTVVADSSALTDEEKANVVEAVKGVNPTATDVQVQADGSVVVTFADGSTANLLASQTVKVAAPAETSATQPKSRSRRAAGQERAQDRSAEGKDINFEYRSRKKIEDGDPTQRAKIEYRQLGDYEVADGKTVATDPEGKGRPVLEWTVTFNEAQYDLMGGYYYFTIPKNVSEPYKVVTEYNNGAYRPRDGWVDGNVTSGGSPSAEGQQFIDAGNKLNWRVGNTVGNINSVPGLSGVMDQTEKVYVLGFANNTKARKVTIKYRTVVTDPSQAISYIAGIDSKTGAPRNNWYGLTGKYDKHLVSQVDAPKVTPNLTNTSVNVPIQTVASTSSTLSGTGVPGAKIKLYIDGQEQNIGNVTVDSAGNWTTGELPTALNNNQGDGTTIKPRQTVEVSQVVNGEESSRRTVPVSVGVTTVEPTNQAAVVAGQKEVTLKVPHDAGIAYMRYTNTAGETVEIPVKRDNASSAWTSQKPEAATVKRVENGKFQDTIILTMADKIAGTEVSAISNVVDGGFSSVAGWEPRGVENQAPTIASAVEGNQKTVAQGAQLDLASLVTVADKEDDAQATLGDKVHAEVVSVNGNTATKTVDTNTPGTYTVRYKAVDSQGKESNEIEVTVVVNPARDNVAPTVEIPYSDPAPNKKEVYLYTGEDADVDITFNDDSGKIKSASLKKGGNIALNNIDGNPDKQDNEYGYTVTAINSETATPAKIKVTGQVSGIAAEKLPKTENDSLDLVTRFATATDTDGALINNTAVKTKKNGEVVGSYLTDPGAVTFVLKAQTKKYDIKVPEEKLPVADANNVTDKEFEKIKEKVKVEYSQNNPDARLADKKGQEVEDASKVVDKVEKDGNNLVVTYKDGSKDTKPLTDFARTNVAPTVEIPYSDPAPNKKEVYLYTGEEADVDITFNDDSGKIKSASLKKGGNIALNNIDGNPDKQDNEYGYTVTAINSETATPAKIKVTGQVSGISAEKLPKTENDSLDLVTRFATATDTDGELINNTAVKTKKNGEVVGSYLTDPGAVTFVLKAQTKKYDIKTPSETDKVTVSDADNVTDKEFEKIKEKVKVEYSQNNPDARLADKKGQEVEDASKVVDKVEKDGNNVVVTYKDGSKDTKPLSEFVNVAPKVEVPYSNEANKQIYVYTGENTDLTFKGTDEKEVKDLYLRGPGDVKENNANKYGFTTGKVENGAVTGEGSVSEDKTSATIKMTGTTNLKAGQEWTSFIVSKDNNGELSNTDYRALDVDPNAKEKPGYVRFVVKNQTSKYDIATPAPADKVEVADPTNVTKDELAKIEEKLKLEYAQTNDDANFADKKGTTVDAKDAKTKIKSVTKDDKGNLVVTYTDGSTDTKPLSEFVTQKPSTPEEPTDADKNEPKAKDQTVKVGEEPKAEDSIENFKGLPEGTTAKFKEPVDTKTPGDKTPTVVVTYPDGSTEEVPVKVTVEKPSTPEEPTDADKNEPKAKDQTVKVGEEPKAEDSIENFKGLPEGTTAKFKEPVDTKTPGDKTPTVVVTYPDGSTEEVPVKVTVEKPSTPEEPTDADKNEPKAKDQTVKVGEEPKAEDSIENFKGLPEGTTAKFKEPVDTKTPGDKTPTVVVTYPDGSTEEVPVKVTVEKPSTPEEPTDADKNEPKAKDQTVKVGEEPKAEDSIENFKGLPEGTTAKFKEPVDTKTPGDKTPTVVVTYPDGSTEEVPVKVTVAKPSSEPTDADKNEPKAKDQTVKVGEEPKAEDSIENFKGLPEGTTAKFKEPVDTKTPGDKTPTVVVTYPDGSTEEVPVKVTVAKPSSEPTDADKNEPKAKDQTVKVGEEPKAEDSIENFKGLPEGTTAKFKEPVDTKTPGDKTPTVVVTYPDGSTEEVPVKVTVAKPSSEPTDADKNEPKAKDQTVKVGEEPKAEDSIENFKGLPEGTTAKFKEPVDTKTPGDKTPTVVVTYPDGSTEEVPVKVTVEKPSTPEEPTDADKNEPKAKDQTVKVGEEPKAEDSIENFKGLPEGTTAKFKEPVDTKTPGDKTPTVVVTYPDGSTEEVPVKVTVEKPSTPEEPTDADKNEPKAKDQTVKVGEEPKAEDSIENFKGLPEGTTAKFKEPVDTKTPGDKTPTVVVTYPDGSTEEVPVKVTVAKPSSEPTDADKNEPKAKDQTVKVGEEPKAEDSIENFKGLPEGTTAKFKEPVDTKTPGDKTPTVVVTYPDGSTEEVPVKVTVAKPSSEPTDADKNEPKAKDQTVKVGEEPKAEDSIENFKGLPEGTTAKFKEPVDTKTPGDKTPTVVVTYPDGSTEEVPVKVTVAKPSSEPTDADKNEPKAKDQTVKVGEEPKAEDSIENFKGLPEGTTAKFKEPVDTKTPGDKTPTVVVTYPDGSTEEVPVKVTVEKPSTPEEPTDADKNEPKAKDQTVKVGEEPKAEDSIENFKGLPEGTTAKFKEPVDTKTPGDKTPTVVVTYPDGSTEEVPVKVTVEKPSAPATDADKNTPVAKDQTVKPGDKPNAKDSIGNVKDLPKGTTVEFKDPVDTTTPGDKTPTVVVTYPDGSKDEVPVKVTVKDPSAPATDADKNTPVAKDQTVKPGDKPNAKDSIGNVKDLPKGTTVEFKDPVDTTTPGDKTPTVVVTYPDGSKDEVPVKVTVKDPTNKVVKDPSVTPVTDPSNLTDAEKGKVAEEVKKSNPTVTDVKVGKDGTTTVTYPDGTTAVIPADKTVKKSDDKAVKDPSVTPVTDPSNLTDAEKAKVSDEVKKSNPTVTDVKVDKDGTTTVTYPDGTTAVIPANKTVKRSVDKELKDPAVTPVTNPSNLTDAEKAKVADEVKKANPTVTDVKVGKDGTTTVTYPDGTTAVIPADKTVKKSADKAVKDPSVTPVTDPSNLTDAEKAKVSDEVKKSNPTVTDVKVDKDGTTTVTYPDGTTAVIPANKTVKRSVDKELKDPAVTPVTNPSNLTDAEKAKVADEVKKANPTVTDVKVGKDGTTTVTYPDGTTAVIPADKTVKKSADKAVKDPSVTPVTDPSNLTDAEKAKVAEEVKKSNPTVTDVKVDKDGTTTVTYPDGTTAVVPADKTVKKSDDKAVKDPSVTPVTDPSNLTDAEKAKVAEEVKKSNPTVTDVKVDKDGTTTVTYPDGTTAFIPADKTVKKSADKAVKDPSVTPVTDPSNLTDAEKAKVADEVKKSNPTVTDVKVGKDGTTTVTYPDGTTAVIPADKTVKKSDDKGTKDPSVTPVTDPSNLTDAEKGKVAEEVKKSNPTVTDVKVGKDGTTTVTYPDGTTAVIPADKTVKKSADKAVKDPSVTPVTDPSNLTDAEKAKVADEVKKSNPTVTNVKVGKDGTTTVTYPDGTTAVIPADKTVKKSADKAVKDPSVTPVTDPSNLTDAEKAKIADEVKKSNPTVTDVKVGKDGTTTVTYPDGTTAVIPADKTVKKSADKAVKDPSVTPVTDPSNLTDAEKAKVADEVKKSNPTVTDVKVGKDGTTTVTYPDGTTAVIPADKTVKKSADKAVKDPSVTPVTDPSNLTDAEKAKIADEVKKSNPTVTDVKVGKDGTTTVTYPDGTTAVIPADKTVKKSADKAVKDPSVTPVTDPSNLTDAEKAKVADEVKKSNPTVTDVKVGKDGTTTVTYPDGTTAVIPADKTAKKSADKAVKDPSVTPVTDPSNLTDAEKGKVADEVKKSNPTVTDVKVGKDGTTTVTYPDGTTAVIPADKTAKKSADKAVKDPSVTPVTDPSNLTDAEKGKVADEVKKSNPTVTDVKVGKDGTTTVTYPDGTTAVIPADKTAKKSADKAVKDPSVTPVTDPSNLTDAEKGKVADEVKKSNPTVTDVKVGKDGTTTVTYPDGTTAVIPADKTVKKSADKVVKDPSVTPVTDPSNLTDAEKGKVADEVKKSNPTAKDIKVNKDGSVIVTFEDGTTAFIPADKTVKKSSDKVKESDGVKNPSVTPVTDPSNLTDAEKAKVAEEVKKSNPTAKDIKVNKDGSVVVTFEDGTTAVIPADKTVKKSSDKVKESDGVKNPSVTPVTDPSNLTDPEKAKVAEEVKKSNPTAKDIKVNKDGSVVVTFEDGTTSVIPADKTVKKSDGSVAVNPATNQDSPAQAPAKKAGAKELPNTGTEQSSASLALALLAAATGGLLFAKKREEEE